MLQLAFLLPLLSVLLSDFCSHQVIYEALSSCLLMNSVVANVSNSYDALALVHMVVCHACLQFLEVLSSERSLLIEDDLASLDILAYLDGMILCVLHGAS